MLAGPAFNGLTPQTVKPMASSAVEATTPAPQGRLKGMPRSINASGATHKTPGNTTEGRISAIATKSDGTSSPNQSPTIRPKSTSPRPAQYIEPDSVSMTATVKIQTVLPPSASGLFGKLTSSPTSPGSTSSNSNKSIDREVSENGIVARSHYRELESMLEERREVWRKDPNNQHLSDYELNEGAKRIEFEEPEMKGLYR
jgi:hypothetical protein